MELARELNYRDTNFGQRNMPRGVKDRFYNRAVPAWQSVRNRAMGLTNGQRLTLNTKQYHGAKQVFQQ